MSEILRGMAIAGGILLPVVVLIVIVSMTAVRRGEAAMRGETHGAEPHAAAAAAPAAPDVKKPAAAAGPEAVPVMEILVFGLVLFGVTVLLLVGVSVLSHL